MHVQKNIEINDSKYACMYSLTIYGVWRLSHKEQQANIMFKPKQIEYYNLETWAEGVWYDRQSR